MEMDSGTEDVIATRLISWWTIGIQTRGTRVSVSFSNILRHRGGVISEVTFLIHTLCMIQDQRCSEGPTSSVRVTKVA